MDAAGNFVVAWESVGQDGDSAGVFGQRFDAAGARLGSEFRVNTFTTSFQRFPAVASDPDGNFLVAWSSDDQDGDGWGIYARRYDGAGNPQTGEFLVNVYTP